MAGYADDFSMSNNALDAYDRGLRPRSKWGQGRHPGRAPHRRSNVPTARRVPARVPARVLPRGRRVAPHLEALQPHGLLPPQHRPLVHQHARGRTKPLHCLAATPTESTGSENRCPTQGPRHLHALDRQTHPQDRHRVRARSRILDLHAKRSTQTRRRHQHPR